MGLPLFTAPIERPRLSNADDSAPERARQRGDRDRRARHPRYGASLHVQPDIGAVELALIGRGYTQGFYGNQPVTAAASTASFFTWLGGQDVRRGYARRNFNFTGFTAPAEVLNNIQSMYDTAYDTASTAAAQRRSQGRHG